MIMRMPAACLCLAWTAFLLLCGAGARAGEAKHLPDAQPPKLTFDTGIPHMQINPGPGTAAALASPPPPTAAVPSTTPPPAPVMEPPPTPAAATAPASPDLPAFGSGSAAALDPTEEPLLGLPQFPAGELPDLPVEIREPVDVGDATAGESKTFDPWDVTEAEVAEAIPLGNCGSAQAPCEEPCEGCQPAFPGSLPAPEMAAPIPEMSEPGSLMETPAEAEAPGAEAAPDSGVWAGEGVADGLTGTMIGEILDGELRKMDSLANDPSRPGGAETRKQPDPRGKRETPKKPALPPEDYKRPKDPAGQEPDKKKPLTNPFTGLPKYIEALIPQGSMEFKSEVVIKKNAPPTFENLEVEKETVEATLLDKYNNLLASAGRVARVEMVPTKPARYARDGSWVKGEFNQIVHDIWGRRLPDYEAEYFVIVVGMPTDGVTKL